jgi:hypothetical protein
MRAALSLRVDGETEGWRPCEEEASSVDIDAAQLIVARLSTSARSSHGNSHGCLPPCLIDGLMTRGRCEWRGNRMAMAESVMKGAGSECLLHPSLDRDLGTCQLS